MQVFNASKLPLFIVWSNVSKYIYRFGTKLSFTNWNKSTRLIAGKENREDHDRHFKLQKEERRDKEILLNLWENFDILSH